MPAIDAIIANFMIWHLHGFKAGCFHTSALIFCTGGNFGANLTFLSFIFGLILPEPYAPEVKSPCQQALEDVMQTFQVVTN